MKLMFPVVLGVAVALSSRGAGSAEPVHATAADLETVMAAVKAPGARAVLVNVWASWCEPCRQEMPDLMQFYQDNRERGLRLIMVSADDEDQRAVVEKVLTKAGFDGPAFIKHGD